MINIISFFLLNILLFSILAGLDSNKMLGLIIIHTVFIKLISEEPRCKTLSDSQLTDSDDGVILEEY